MKKVLLLVIVFVVLALAYLFVFNYAPYDRLKAIEEKHGLNDSFMPASQEELTMVKSKLTALSKSLDNEQGNEADAVKVLVEVRLDLVRAAEKFFLAEKNMSAVSPFSNNCIKGKPVYEASLLMDEAVENAKTASQRMELFLKNYKAEAVKFGVNDNYAKQYANFLEETVLIEKNSLKEFC